MILNPCYSELEQNQLFQKCDWVVNFWLEIEETSSTFIINSPARIRIEWGIKFHGKAKDK